jgi:trimethyllysine dioxygenase
LNSYGIGFVDGTPPTPQATLNLIQRITFLRETHYGSLWDFTNDLAHGDTAYTQLALPAHTDTTYFTDPVGYQCFHLLEHQGTGGQSLFVDGFNVARQLFNADPNAFSHLTQIRIQSHASGDPHVFMRPQPLSGYPILNLDPKTRELYQIRFNNDDRSRVDLQDSLDFYKSLKAWTQLLKASKNELWLSLKPGRVVLFNNWRVLHGRSAFTGKRRMVGCYLGMDDVASRMEMVLHQGQEKTRI